MAKLTLSDPSNIQNETTFLSILAANNTATETAMEKTLSRDGTEPNNMEDDLDMDSNRILNLPDAVNEQEPATYGQVLDFIDALENGAVVDASFVTLDNHSQITNERVLTSGSNVSITDNGAGSTVVVDLPSSLTFTGKTIEGGTFNSASINTLDNAFAIYDNSDNTKGMQFQVSGVSTGTTRTFTVPDANTTLVGTDVAQTLTNKTVALGSNTVSGTTAEFNTALTDNNFATQAGSETLTNKTIALGSNTVSGTTAQFNTALSDNDFATQAGSETLTNKTMSGASNTFSNLALNQHATQAAYTFVGNNSGSSASPTAVDIATLTAKGSPAGTDLIMISDQAASGAWKKATLTSVASAGAVSDIDGATGSIDLAGHLSISSNILSAIIKGHLFGLTLSNNVSDLVNDIDIAAGEASSDSATPQLMRLSTGLTKRLDAGWAAGTNQGMRNSAAALADNTYHIYLVSKANGADVDVYAHTSTNLSTVLTSLQAESGGASYTSLRRIGSIVRLSSTIKPFIQFGNRFKWDIPVPTNFLSTLGTTASLATLTVPVGIKVQAICTFIGGKSGASANILVTSPDQQDLTMGSGYTIFSVNDTGNYYGYGSDIVGTNTSGQIRCKSSLASTEFYISCLGWIDDAIPQN